MPIKTNIKMLKVEIVKKSISEDKLLEEINEDRIKHGKKPIENLNKKEIMFDEEIGEVIENKDTKHIKESFFNRSRKWLFS